MKNDNKTDLPFQKKTERLDVRVSHEKKKAFAEACENQGDTPSNAVRRFITTYIRREQRDELASAIRFSPKKRYLGYAVIAGAIVLGGSFIWSAAAHQKQDALADELFAAYDKNNNDVIDLGEISLNDYHLQRVLNIDGIEGISKSEFVLEGEMMWRFVDPETYQILEDKTGLFKQTSSKITMSISLSGEPIDSDQKMFVSVDGELVELRPDMTPKERAGLLSKAEGMKPREELEHANAYSDAYHAAIQKYAPKMVTFDLRDQDRLNITVLEQQPSVTAVQKYTNFQRSVDWVEGRPTPEFVMGKGRETAVLTTAR